MKKVVCIVGPTSVGKTKLSVELAKIFNAEVINADSVSAYKELNVGSAKVTTEEMDGIKHHLVDVVDLGDDFSVADFQKQSRQIIDNSDKYQFVCGGTGLYIKASMYHYEFGTKRNDDFIDKYEDKDNDELYEMLISYNVNYKNKIHKNNRVRVLRALEKEVLGIKVIEKKDKPYYNSLILYLKLDRELLYKRINDRVDKMMNNGLLDEVERIYNNGHVINAIGYKEFIPYFENKETLDEVVSNIKRNTRRFAKRQHTWFKNQFNDLEVIDVNLDCFDNTVSEAKKIVGDFLNGK